MVETRRGGVQEGEAGNERPSSRTPTPRQSRGRASSQRGRSVRSSTGRDDAPAVPSTNPSETELLRLQVALAKAELENERLKKRRAADAELSSRGSGGHGSGEEGQGEVATQAGSSAIDAEAYLLAEPPYIDPKERAILSRQERNFSPQEVREYHGGNVAVAQAFIRACETVFRMQPHIYYYQRDKYMYAISRFRGVVQSNWPARERQLSADEHTWITLRSWILDREQDPHNRSVTYALRLFRDVMQEGQKVETFVSHLETAEMEVDMEPFTDTQKSYLLVTGLPTALRNKLLEQQHVPFKMNELVPLLSRLEQNLKSTPKGRATEERSGGEAKALAYRDRHSNQKRGGYRTDGPSDQQGFRAATAQPRRAPFEARGEQPRTSPATGVNAFTTRCFKCNMTGHWARECPKNGRP